MRYYIISKGIKVATSEPNAQNINERKINYIMATCIVKTGNDNGVNIRPSKSTSGNRLGVINNGVSVNVVRCDGTWATLMYNGTPAFVQHKFLQNPPTINGDGLSVNDAAVSNGDKVNIRDAANGNLTRKQMNKGDNHTVLGKSLVGNFYWYKINTNQWVRGDYLTPGTSSCGNSGESTGGGSGGNTATWEQVLAGSAVYKKESSSSAVCEGVKTLQRYLIAIGWGRAAVLGATSDMTVDGNFGAQTEKAVKNFQYECGLTQDGIVGSQTAIKLDNARSNVNFTTKKFYPLAASEWNYNALPSWVDDISLCARMICAEHSRNGYPSGDEDARAGIAKVFRNRKNSSQNFNEVNGLKTYKAIIFGTNQYNPATGAASSRKMAYFVWRGAGNGVPWQQAISYATQLVNGQAITRAANVTNQVYFNGYTLSWSATGKKDIVYYPDEPTKKFTAFFNK